MPGSEMYGNKVVMEFKNTDNAAQARARAPARPRARMLAPRRAPTAGRRAGAGGLCQGVQGVSARAAEVREGGRVSSLLPY